MPASRGVSASFARETGGHLWVARSDINALVGRIRALEARNQLLARQSATDGLTGLPNRRSFDETLAVEWQRAARGSTPLSFLMIDIDHFKRYNDFYGHLAGDDCLRHVAGVLTQCVRRAGETAARYGGEEFVLLLPGSDMAHACDTAQKCIDLMQLECLPHADSPTASQVTVSIGVACLQPLATEEPSSMINAADAAMYRAKREGRAHFSVADQADWQVTGEVTRTPPVAFT